MKTGGGNPPAAITVAWSAQSSGGDGEILEGASFSVLAAIRTQILENAFRKLLG